MKPFQDQTYYELLEVPTRASNEEILEAYQRASTLYAADSVAMYALENPELGDDLRARLREAMEILTDEDLRGEYDRMIGVARITAPSEMLRRQQERDDEGDYEGPPSELRPEPRDDSEEAEPTQETPVLSESPAAQVAAAELPASTSPVMEVPPFRAPPAPAAAIHASAPEASRPAPPPMEVHEERNVLRSPPPPSEPELRYAPDPRATPRARLDTAQMMASDSAIADAESALAEVAAKVKEAPPRPKAVEINGETEFSGELLRRVRESRGASLHQVADRTRIGSRHLENIEADKYTSLPATVYLRGMLQSLAREIGLDPARVAKSYLSLAKR